MKNVRRSFACSCAFLLVGALAGCNNGNGDSKQTFRYFVGMNNFGECGELFAGFDLEAAGAVVARTEDGDPDCTIDPALAVNGCALEIRADANAMGVRVEGCEIPAVTNLFSCLFEQGTVRDLDEQMNADCTCANEPICHFNTPCLRLPALCISETPDPRCEICDNGIDDDGDGKLGCDDPNCDADCGVGQTTITCPSSTGTYPPTTSTDTTSTSSTSPPSTVPVEPIAVQFRLTSSSAAVGALQWSVNYAATGGEFLGSGANVECASLVPGALPAFNDREDVDTLNLGLIALTPFSAPVVVAECSFVVSSPPQVSDFVVTIEDATDTDGIPVDATVEVEIVIEQLP
jgi:hypothetical protein